MNSHRHGERGVILGTTIFTACAMVAFAANSVLGGLALGANTIEPASFTVVQLTVPVIAAAGGVVWVAETPGTRLVVSSVIVLGGIAMVFKGRDASAKHRVMP